MSLESKIKVGDLVEASAWKDSKSNKITYESIVYSIEGNLILTKCEAFGFTQNDIDKAWYVRWPGRGVSYSSGEVVRLLECKESLSRKARKNSK